METTGDPQRALAAAEQFLVARPVENNVMLGLLHQRLRHAEPGRYWTVRGDAGVTGFAMQSPSTFPALLTTMPVEATRSLAATMAAEVGHALPGILAQAGTAADFAGAWSESLPGCVVTPGEGQRLYRLQRLVRPPQAPGGFRRAKGGDRDLLMRWWRAFGDETEASGAVDPAAAVDRELGAGRIFLWEDDEPVCMARATAGVAGVSRIGFVYTPAGHRRHGYAAACVAALTDWLQRNEDVTCVLYTQLSNPGSNRLYRRLGYGAVAELLGYRFRPAPAATNE